MISFTTSGSELNAPTDIKSGVALYDHESSVFRASCLIVKEKVGNHVVAKLKTTSDTVVTDSISLFMKNRQHLQIPS